MDGAACGYPLPEGASARYAHPSCFMPRVPVSFCGLALKSLRLGYITATRDAGAPLVGPQRMARG
ncbi:MAG: hypothetical protein ACE1ZP_00040, partial [Myxococcota bacterium]